VAELENTPDFGLGFFELAHLTSVPEPAIDATGFQRLLGLTRSHSPRKASS
jgi:hypothetical protein